MIRVVVVDDESLVREGLVVIAGSADDIEVVGAAADGLSALDEVAARRPDVVLMDVRMPRMDGIAATAALARSHPATRVLVLTTVETDDVVYEALRAGACGFLLKSCPREELWHGIRVAAAGDSLLAPSVTRRLIEAHVRAPRPGGDPSLQLTERQTDVVRLVARGLSNAEIAATLHLAETTVKGYLSEILARLQLRDRTQLVVRAYESGLVRPGGDPGD
jgi:DNA-binding NarL/FixJ family response regulator